ncbi:hypothetical protein HMN09_01382800 [Mycena chlorophos]|uniref:Membrane-associated protein n=1 Tax=Mycena chlorophos TaxID=658473 RepID=A0A8H6RX66_MYCCL|nr:hypothetical protein HMN09_01382800 [Mycena chlorophos]
MSLLATMSTPMAHFWLVLTFLPLCVIASEDFTQCFNETRSGLHGLEGLLTNKGVPTRNLSQATAMTYAKCIETCGGGGGAFSWSSFSQQFSAWLLPWLALLSQFPFGSPHRWDNLLSVFLSLGSPCLAAYSITLTVLNTKWVVRRFSVTKYPNNDWAVLMLSSLQHMPLKVTALSEEGWPLLSSLVVLPENDDWWVKVEDKLGYSDLHTWSIASIFSIVWVVIAYVLTVVDAFTTVSTDPNSNGQGLSGVGSIWLWMIPVTVAYLQLSPRCDYERVSKALHEANELAYATGPNGVVPVSDITDERAFSIHNHAKHQALYADQEATAPIYNYARFLPFVHVVEDVAGAFDAATKRAHNRLSVSGARWEPGDGRKIHSANRRGTADEVEAYCTQPPRVRQSHWGAGVFTRFLIASVSGLGLQWATTGASVAIVYFTPTVGMGCRSGAYLVYGGAATLVWFMMVVSSFLAHYATSYTPRAQQSPSEWTAEHLSILLRRFAKTLATLNAAWIVVAFMLQFANFYDRCYCNADVLGLGRRAHIVMVLLPSDISNMTSSWGGGVALGIIASAVWWGWINVLRDPLPQN